MVLGDHFSDPLWSRALSVLRVQQHSNEEFGPGSLAAWALTSAVLAVGLSCLQPLPPDLPHL